VTIEGETIQVENIAADLDFFVKQISHCSTRSLCFSCMVDL